MERKYLAIINLDGDTGRGILAAEKRRDPDDGSQWAIIALLPDGSEEETDVTAYHGLSGAVECIEQAWGADIWGLEWLPSEEEMSRLCGR